MAWYDRVRAIFSTGERAPKQLPAGPANSGLVTTLNKRSDPPIRGTKERLEAFENVPRLYAPLWRIAESVASVPFKAYRLAPEKEALRRLKCETAADGMRQLRRQYLQLGQEQRSGFVRAAVDVGVLEEATGPDPVIDMLETSTPELLSRDIVTLETLYVDVDGNSFTILEPNKLGELRFRYPVPSHWVQRTPFVGYPFYRVAMPTGTVEIPQGRMVWTKRPSLVDPYGRGVGYGTVLATELDADDYAAKLQVSKFFNKGLPEWVIALLGLTPDQVKEAEEKWKEKHSGWNKSGVPHFTGMDLKAIKLDHDFVDLDLVALREFEGELTRTTIGVVPEVMGDSKDSNKATITSAFYLYSKTCIVPRCDRRADMLNARIAPMLGGTNIYDYDSPVPEDTDGRRAFMSQFPGIFTINELREEIEFPARDGGDELNQSAGAIPEITTGDDAEDQADAPAKPDQAQPAADQAGGAREAKVGTIQAALAIVTQVAAKEVPRESGKAIMVALMGLTADVAESILPPDDFEPPVPEPAAAPVVGTKSLPATTLTLPASTTAVRGSLHQANGARLATVQLVGVRAIGDRINDAIGDSDLAEEVTDFWDRQIAHYAEQSARRLKLDVSVSDIQKLAAERARKFGAQRSPLISDSSRGKLRKIVADGLEEGRSIDEIRAAVGDRFQQWSEARATRITIAEVHHASNGGLLDLYGEAGVEFKRWLSQRDGAVRDTHSEADGQVVELDDDFVVGGARGPAPGDLDSVEEVAGCRCYMLPSKTDRSFDFDEEWRALVANSKAWEALMLAAVRRMFEKQERRVLAVIKRAS